MAGITLTIEVDDKGTVKVKQFADESKKAFDQMQSGPKAAQGPLADLRESWVGLTAKVTMATAAVYAVGKAFSSFINEAAEAEQIENRLRFALETTGYSWQYAKSAVDEFATSIQASTRFSDEQASQALTDMMMYTQDFTKAQMGAKLAMDMSIRTGRDLRSSAVFIGMAMSGNVEMLGRYIPELRNLDARLGSNATQAQKAEYAMKVLQEKFSGTAQADVKSYAGQVAQFKNAWSDLKEEIGYGLLPVLKETFKWLTDILRNMEAQRKLQKEMESQTRTAYWQTGEYMPVGAFGAPTQYEVSAQARITAYRSQMLAAQTKFDSFVEGALKKEDIEKDVLEFHKLIAEADKLSELGKMPSWEDWANGIVKTFIPNVIELDLNFAKIVAEADRLSDLGEMPSWEDWADRIPKRTLPDIIALELEFKKLVAEAERLSDLGQMPDWREPLERIIPKFKANVSEMQTMWNSLGESFSDIWASNMTRMIRDSENAGEAFKNIFQSMADVFISSVAKMIVEWLVFEKVKGEEKKFLGGGSGIGTAISWIGGLVGLEKGGIAWEPLPIKSFQAGGVATNPTLAMFGEKPEAFVPLQNGKIPVEIQDGGRDSLVVQNFIQVTDPNTFVKIYGPIVKKLSEQSAAEAKRFSKISTRG